MLDTGHPDGLFLVQEFADNIRMYRRRQQLSQRDIAKVIGISASTYNRVENALVPPTSTVFMALCWLFDISPSQFYAAPKDIYRQRIIEMVRHSGYYEAYEGQDEIVGNIMAEFAEDDTEG